MNPSRPQPDGAPASGDLNDAGKPARRPGPTKFVYASGDRPLEGYTIRRGIGRGGFGEVYFAESDAGKEVAMKLIRRNLDVEIRGVRHCLNLKHPNLIALYDIRTDDGGDEWVIMEYVTGAGTGANSLEEVIDRHPDGMPEADVVRWMHGIAAGVAHLHDNGIVHRDLKPGNIFLDGPTVKIGDYGLSKFISCSRRSGQTESVGTVHYMAPEIANGRYGREIDTYALGVILYEMLTGHVPFEGESVGEVLMKHLTAEPDLARVAEPYREIVRRTLAKDPETRIRSVGELVAMLPGGAPVHPAAVSPFGPATDSPQLDPTAPISADPRQRAAHPQDADEPIYRTLADGWAHFWDGWRHSQMNPLGKAILMLLGLGTAVFFAWVWVPALVSLAVFYCIYYVLWCAFLKPDTPTHSVDYEPHRLAPQPPPKREDRHAKAADRRRRRLGWREAARHRLANKPWRERVTGLVGSMLMAAVFCGGFSFAAMALLSNGAFKDSTPVMLWLSIVTTLGAWAVLLTNTLTEGRAEDQTPMRGLLLALGAGVGLVAGMLSVGLPVGLPCGHDFGPDWNQNFADALMAGSPEMISGSPVAPVGLSVAYFAGLFFMIRWWRQAEWTRDKRFSLLSVFGCMLGAWLLHMVLWYPQPAGIAVAAIVSVATQLSSAWLPPSQREKLARGGAA